MSELKRDVVVVPLDFSEASQNALRVALEMTGSVSKIRALHVMPPLEAISPAVVWGDLSDEQREASVRGFAEEFLETHGAAGAQLDVRVGSPGHEITDFADDVNADLVIISSHGYHGLKRMLLGSVAESVIRHAHCAVLVLRRQDAE